MITEGRRLDIIKRFWSKVDKTGDCWIWTASKNYGGYGYFGISIGGKPKVYKAHRIAYILGNKKLVPKGTLVCHTCDNPSCVNPDHLFIGTDRDNTNDKMKKNRQSRMLSARNPSSKLTEPQVAEIRRLYASGGTTYQELGSKFSVTKQTIFAIIKNKQWAKVQNLELPL